MGNLFGIGWSTCSFIIEEFCAEVKRKLTPRFIGKFYPPTVELIQEITTGFEEKWGFPQVYGCIGKDKVNIVNKILTKITVENRSHFFLF